MTASHSSSLVVKSMRSRRKPALFTSTSSPPKVSIASRRVAARPPSRRCRRCSQWPHRPRPGSRRRLAAPDRHRHRVPSRATPRSLTTTFAPSRANASACSRPIPRPAPVMATTRPWHNTVGTLPACSSGSPCSRPTRRSAWSSSRARSRIAVSRRCTSPSTRTSRRVAARRRPRATTELARGVQAHARSVRRARRWPPRSPSVSSSAPASASSRSASRS